MRVSLQIDGDAKGAEDAVAATSAAVTDLGKQTSAISQAIQDGFKSAVDAIDGMKKSSQSSSAANDNAAGSALGLAAKISQVAASAAGADSALAKGAAGAVSFAKGLGDAVKAVGAFNVVGALLGLAVTVATTFYGVINSGATEAAKRLDEQARLIGVVRDAYKDAAKTAGEFYTQSKNLTLFQAEQNLIGLQADLAKKTVPLTAGNSYQPTPPPQAFGGEIDAGYAKPQQEVSVFQKAIDDLTDSAARGVNGIAAYRDEVARIGAAAQASSPAVAAAANELLNESKAAGEAAVAVAKSQAMIAVIKGTATEAQEKLLGIAKATSQTANEFDRLVKSMSRQAAAQEAEAQTMGKTAGEAAKLRAEFILTEAAQQAGIKVTGAYADKLQAVATRAGAAAQALALARVNDQVKFGADTALLAPEDVAIAQQLKDVYPDVASSLDSVHAAAMRANTALGGLSSSTAGTLVTGLTDITDGTKSVSKGAEDMARSVVRSLHEMMIKAMIVMPIFRALQSALGGFGGLLGFSGGASNATDGIGGFGPTAPSFDRGGYTGAGARHQAKGIVHAGEVVFSQDDVRRHGGVRAVESLRTMRGYLGGGAVSPWAGASRSASMPANSNAAPPSGEVAVSVTNNGTPKDVEARQVVDGRGRRRIDLTLDDQQAAAISRPGSATGRAMSSRFGARPVGVQR